MRIVSFSGPTSRQAMADLRAALGEDAVILSARTLDDGQVCVTGAVNEDAFDLADVLEPSIERSGQGWLRALAAYHEWPFTARSRIEPLLDKIQPAEPEVVLTTLLQALFRFDDGERWIGEKTLVFSGPPGGGKSVTIAKIAAEQTLAGDAVDVLTLDVGRAGGLDQLKTLLAPLNIVPKPVPEAAKLPDVLKRCKGDVVLVDTIGTNPFEPSDLGALSTLVVRAGAELLLVLPAGLGCADSAEIARNYAALGAKTMMVTKLDVARRLSGVLAAAEAGLAFSKVGIGPSIGDGLSSLSAGGLARLLLRRYRSSIVEEASR